MPVFTRLSVAFVRGEGAWLWDNAGKKYLDALSGLAVCGLGHAHPAITEAICSQAGKLIHTSNWYEIPLQEELGERLKRVELCARRSGRREGIEELGTLLLRKERRPGERGGQRAGDGLASRRVDARSK